MWRSDGGCGGVEECERASDTPREERGQAGGFRRGGALFGRDVAALYRTSFAEIVMAFPDLFKCVRLSLDDLAAGEDSRKARRRSYAIL